METTSPMDAAKGVAKLSGFMLYFLESRITATNTKSNTKHDEVAVNIAAAMIRRTWSNSNSLVELMAKPTEIANTATKKDATIDWTWTKDILPAIILNISFRDVIFPKLACVDKRDAKHMSKFPLRPNKAGTKIYNSGICLNTSQSSTLPRIIPAPIVPIPAKKNGIDTSNNIVVHFSCFSRDSAADIFLSSPPGPPLPGPSLPQNFSSPLPTKPVSGSDDAIEVVMMELSEPVVECGRPDNFSLSLSGREKGSL